MVNVLFRYHIFDYKILHIGQRKEHTDHVS